MRRVDAWPRPIHAPRLHNQRLVAGAPAIHPLTEEKVVKYKAYGNNWAMKSFGLGVLMLSSVLAVAQSTSPSTPTAKATNQAELGISDTGYSLSKLIAAAKNEAPITVSDTTGKISDIAKAFTAKYGVQATGIKIPQGQQAQVITREAQARNVKTAAIFLPDASIAVQLVKQGILTTWMPPDLKSDVPAKYQNPLVIDEEPQVWTYNTEVYGDTCPVKNLWDLTKPDWSGRVAMYDPMLQPISVYLWNQMAEHGDSAMKKAYQSAFGKELKTNQSSATAAWIVALAKNKPILKKSDEDTSAAVGATGQAKPPVGLMSTAKFRDNKSLGYKLGICKGLAPWAGFASPKIGAIATGTKSPNAAKLFVHYMLTEEGFAPQTVDEKKSTNKNIELPSEPSNVKSVWEQLFKFDPSTLLNDLQQKQTWSDLWMTNHG